jgi:hypothetical protein
LSGSGDRQRDQDERARQPGDRRLQPRHDPQGGEPLRERPVERPGDLVQQDQEGQDTPQDRRQRRGERIPLRRQQW